MLPMLHTQHRYYTTELAATHQHLGKLYKKLAKIERQFNNGEADKLNRKDKKKLKWTQMVTEQSVQKLEVQQLNLETYLRQCNEMTQYISQASPFSPYSPVAPNPWTSAGPQQAPQYWDLSMLRENRRQSSPYTSSTDSGFYEATQSYAQSAFAVGEEVVPAPDHVFAHEIMAAAGAMPSISVARSEKSNSSESKDEVPELPSAVSNTAAELDAIAEGIADMACLLRRRRHSENAPQVLDSRFGVQHQRGVSMGPVPYERAGSVA
ncbi:hypothetical protein LTR27_006487 [Elasticomyces elasticus]|nr:hypothetical protein LTR27_006487 [Elasticomyces elasticus]